MTDYNRRFGREPLVAKDLRRPVPATDDLVEVLAWREERTVTANLVLHYDRMMLLLEPTAVARGLARKTVEVVNYPDGRFAVRHGARTWRSGRLTSCGRLELARWLRTSGWARCWRM